MVELGRRDGRISTKASVHHRLSQPSFHLDQLNAMFASLGLSQTDMIALSSTSYIHYHLFHLIPSIRGWLKELYYKTIEKKMSTHILTL